MADFSMGDKARVKDYYGALVKGQNVWIFALPPAVRKGHYEVRVYPDGGPVYTVPQEILRKRGVC